MVVVILVDLWRSVVQRTMVTHLVYVNVKRFRLVVVLDHGLNRCMLQITCEEERRFAKVDTSHDAMVVVILVDLFRPPRIPLKVCR